MTTAQGFAPRSGTDGRIKQRTNGGDVIVAGVRLWRRTGTARVIELPHFNGPAQVNGLNVPTGVLSLGRNQFKVEGFYNFDATSATETGDSGFENGDYVFIDFIDSVEKNKGYPMVEGWIQDFDHGTSIDDQAAPFSFTLHVNGPLPSWGSIS